MTRRTGHPSGFSLLELTVVATMGALVVLAALQLFTTTSDVSESSRQRLRLAADHRDGQERLGWLLRTARSVTGFDPVTGQTSALRMTRVTDATTGVPVVSDQQILTWVRSGKKVPGVATPGRVELVSATERKVVVEDVPGGGFWVRQEAGWLTLHLTTYRQTQGQADAELMTTESVVGPRNLP